MAFFQFSRGYQIAENYENTVLEFTVPTDKELIIEEVTGDANVPQGQALFVVFQLISAPPPAGSGTTTGIYFVPAQRVGFFSSTADILLFCQSMRVHANPGTQVSISVGRLNLTSPTGIVGGNFTMTGEIFDAGTWERRSTSDPRGPSRTVAGEEPSRRKNWRTHFLDRAQRRRWTAVRSGARSIAIGSSSSPGRYGLGSTTSVCNIS